MAYFSGGGSRFDRVADDNRISYLSTMSMLRYKDGDHGNYLEIAEFLSNYDAQSTAKILVETHCPKYNDFKL